MRLVMILMAGVLPALLAACATTAAADDDDPSPYAGLDADNCVLTQRGALVLAHGGDARVSPGEAVPVTPFWTPYPSAFIDVPHRCLTGWRVSDSALARLSADRATLTVAPDAPVGARFTLTARYRNRAVERHFEVVRRVASPLVGNWRPVAGACAERTAITGLAIRDDGSFAVETIMRPHYSPSAAGTWQVDGDRLLLTPEYASNGNHGPSTDFQTEARFTITDDILRFDRPWHGSVEGHGTCNAPLQRVR